MNILLKYHIRKEDEKYSLDEKCWTIYPPEIAKSDLPSNRLYDLPSNRLWRFTPPAGFRGEGVNHTDDLRVNCSWRFEGKSDLAISGG